LLQNVSSFVILKSVFVILRLRRSRRNLPSQACTANIVAVFNFVQNDNSLRTAGNTKGLLDNFQGYYNLFVRKIKFFP